jgi:hypothetical protein
MTGFRASPLRRKCAQCERTFRPARRHADYCSPGCQKAASRDRIKAAQLRADAEAVFKVAVNSHLLRERLDRNQDGAIILSGNFTGIRAIATERGYLIAGPLEALEGLYGTGWIQSHKPSFILPEELPGLLRTRPGAPFRYREVERDFLRILKREESPLILLEDDPAYYADVPPRPHVPWFERPGIPNDEDVIPFDDPGPRLGWFEMLEWREMIEKAEAELTAIDKGWFEGEE